MGAFGVVARAWADHAGAVWLLLTALLLSASGLGAPPGSPAFWGLSALWFVTTAQALRRLWHRSRLVASSLGIGVPVLMLVIPYPHARLDAAGLLFFAPAAAAAVAEVAVRRLRLDESVREIGRPPEVAAPPPGPGDGPMARARRHPAAGCVAALLLAGSCVGWAGWKLGEPARNAHRARSAIRGGMTLTQVIAQLQGGFRATALGDEADPEAEPIRLSTLRGDRLFVSVGATVRSSLSRAEAMALLERETRDGSPYRTLALTFTAPGVPPKVSFDVSFGADGRVIAVSTPRTWD